MATRRSTTIREIGNPRSLSRRAANNKKRTVNGKLVSQSRSVTIISQLHRQLVPDKHSISFAKRVPDGATLSTDVLQAIGISVSTNSQRRKKDFSIIKTQKTSMIVKNPAILDAYSYKRLPRLPVPANSIFKNQNDAFFAAAADQKLSRARRKEMEKYMTPNPVDLTGVALLIVNKTQEKTYPLRALITKGKY
jgi:hypothetical protein